MNQIEMKNVFFRYTKDDVLDDLSLTVKSGEVVAILGENGSGKSTLLKILLGEMKPRSGSVKILGEEVSQLKSYRQIGYVPQVQNVNRIAFPITVLELVVLNLYEKFGWTKIPKKKHVDAAKIIIDKMGLGEYIHAPFNELSGGLKQRAMIARAMINQPDLLVLDEPTAGVDNENKISFLQRIGRLNQEENITVLLVSHEMSVLRENLTIHQVYQMNEGRLHHVIL